NGSDVVADGEISIPGASSLRAVAADARALFVADFWCDRLFSTRFIPFFQEKPMGSRPLCGGPIRLALTEHFVGAVCLFDHSIVLFERDGHGLAGQEIQRITHDGPIWGFSLVEEDGGLFIAAGGVEDHPLDRRDKAFGYVDSFVYLYRLDSGRRLNRLFAQNTSELGVVTPKVTKLAVSASAIRLTVVGYASDDWIELELGRKASDDPTRPWVRAKHAGVPGCSDVAFTGDKPVCANPLLDAWV